MIKRIFIKSRGQTLVETVIALAVALIIISSITILVVTALSNAQYSRQQNVAAQYAQELMSQIRDYKDTNPAGFFANFGNKLICVGKGESVFSAPSRSVGVCGEFSCPPPSPPRNIINTDGQYRRQVCSINHAPSDPANKTPCGPNTIFTTVDVMWSDGKCQSGNPCHSVTLNSCFSNSLIVPGP